MQAQPAHDTGSDHEAERDRNAQHGRNGARGGADRDTAVLDGYAERMAATDPLLPTFTNPAASASAVLRTRDGIAFATRSAVPPRSMGSLWRPLVEYRLDLRVAGSDPGAAVDGLLCRWEDQLAEAVSYDEGYGWDSAAVVTRPSRDTTGTTALLRRGFAATRVLAVRPANRLGAGPPAVPGVRIRAAEEKDLPALTRMRAELHAYDAQFGVVTARSDALEQLTEDARAQLAADRPVPQLWIAELYGRPLGFLEIELPPEANWIAGYVHADRVAYLASLHVAEEARSSGVGSALVAHAHQLFDSEDIEAALLHHALESPRSTPFWYAHGYRPLWTSWYRRPAVG
ncbi:MULTISPECIES: GNAT family N-acetyltransferase [Prauserella salsuginis group]|uniref:GNAT family N-acetyltransferase n=1 Tax=Prauserella salsuginis TaxID=387889 RepID=A0ABW6G2D7_9PSEU|nr:MULTISPECIES: GNAT family N-acetyltransferase [Prauserella salsuginis group]MCR3719888.1 Ribosomal protein S18 acetylase RimI [Prauserella flava]MCR3736569.1 Ribosomal protein S18 acetylase RimI [Prauserella salsuginis]